MKPEVWGTGNGARQGWETRKGKWTLMWVCVCRLELSDRAGLVMGVWVMGMGVPGP